MVMIQITLSNNINNQIQNISNGNANLINTVKKEVLISLEISTKLCQNKYEASQRQILSNLWE